MVSRAALREDPARLLGLHDAILGEVESLKTSKGEYLAAVEAGLMEPKPTALSFARLVNSVSLFRQSMELAECARVRTT